MQQNNLSINKITERPFNLNETTAKMPISEVFSNEADSFPHLKGFTLFVAHFNSIPNVTYENNINTGKANIWFAENYKIEIKDFYYNGCKTWTDKTKKMSSVFYILNDLIVKFDCNDFARVSFFYRETEFSKVEEIIKAIREFKNRIQKCKPQIFLLVNRDNGIETKSLDITKPRLRIEDNYNEDFKEIHQTILKRLSRKNDKGLVLLHGKPGTGKTSYIRYLIASLKKYVIFLPLNMASAITNHGLISILIDNPNTILVIEDAENIIVDREIDGNSPVSALLNISDGLLADCLNVQIICTFNTDLSKIDSALMRKGRMIAKYEFKELEIGKAQNLSNKLGFSTIINSPMTLTEIYNQDEKGFQQTRKQN